MGGETGNLQLWDVATQQSLGRPLSASGDAIDTVALSADSGTVYTGSARVPPGQRSDPSNLPWTVSSGLGCLCSLDTAISP